MQEIFKMGYGGEMVYAGYMVGRITEEEIEGESEKEGMGGLRGDWRMVEEVR